MPTPNICCALLTSFRFDWAASLALSAPGLDFVTLSPAAVGLEVLPNPFGLPEASDAEVVLLSTSWFEWLSEHHFERSASVLDEIEARCSLLVGLDAADGFALSLAPQVFERATIVLKLQGMYRDRDLYNYEVGASFPGSNWTVKRQRRDTLYEQRHLDKLRLSVPCHMLDLSGLRRDARRREAGVERTVARSFGLLERKLRNGADPLLTGLVRTMPLSARRLEVHCVVGLSHVQRLETLSQLEGLSGARGIASFPPHVNGTQYGWNLSSEVYREITAAATPHRCKPMSRPRYLMSMGRHKIGVAPTGFGELGQRHGAVLIAGGALVCQDLSHVEMMFPLTDRENVVFCRPDLSDLRTRVEELLDDDAERKQIARTGRRSFTTWSRNWRQHLYDGFTKHILEARPAHWTRSAISDYKPTVGRP